MEMAEPTSKDDQDRPRVHGAACPCKLLQDALTSILKCLGLDGGAAGLDNSSTPGDEKNDQGKVRGLAEEEEEDSVEDSSLPTRQALQGGDVSSGAAQDPTAADDPPPSSTKAVESDAIITRALFRKPVRLPVNTGSGPKKN